MNSKTDIISLGMMHNIPKRNKLKGIAQEKLLSLVFGSKNDISIKNLLKKLDIACNNYFYVNISFFINNILFKPNYNNKYEFYNFNLINSDEENKYVLKTISHNAIFCYCSFCKNRTQINSINVPFLKKILNKKCYFCKKEKTLLSQKETKYNEIIFYSREDLLEYLFKSKIIKKILPFSKRLDFFKYNEVTGDLEIYESKNKEITGLQAKDVYTTLKYVDIMQSFGYNVKHLIIIYNGGFSFENFILEEALNSRNYYIEPRAIKKYIEDKGFFISKIIVEKNNNKYDYKIITGKEENIIIILPEE